MQAANSSKRMKPASVTLMVDAPPERAALTAAARRTGSFGRAWRGSFLGGAESDHERAHLTLRRRIRRERRSIRDAQPSTEPSPASRRRFWRGSLNGASLATANPRYH